MLIFKKKKTIFFFNPPSNKAKREASKALNKDQRVDKHCAPDRKIIFLVSFFFFLFYFSGTL